MEPPPGFSDKKESEPLPERGLGDQVLRIVEGVFLSDLTEAEQSDQVMDQKARLLAQLLTELVNSARTHRNTTRKLRDTEEKLKVAESEKAEACAEVSRLSRKLEDVERKMEAWESDKAEECARLVSVSLDKAEKLRLELRECQEEADRLRVEIREGVDRSIDLEVARARVEASVEERACKAYWDGVFDCRKGVLRENSKFPLTFFFIPPERMSSAEELDSLQTRAECPSADVKREIDPVFDAHP